VGRLTAAAVVFDLDGTLVDSRRDIATAVDLLRRELGLVPLGLAAVTGMVGEGARVLVERAFADAPGIDLDRAVARYLELYAEVCLDTTVPYPGIPELVRTLAARLPLAVVTNKPEAMSRRIFDHLGLSPYFRLVIGGDTLPVRKPDPAGLALVAATVGVAVEDLWLVGDSLVDAATARAAGCRLALVTWGFIDREALAGARPDLLVDETSALASLAPPSAAAGSSPT
jgi:phosphoglycolate phosphatase